MVPQLWEKGLRRDPIWLDVIQQLAKQNTGLGTMRIFNAVIIIVMASSVVAADAYTIYGILKYPNNTAVQYEEIFIDYEPHAYDCAKFSGESTMSDLEEDIVWS